LIQRKPTNAATPFLCILDEYGYYAVERICGCACSSTFSWFLSIFAGQDLPAFEKASKEEAASIGANTNIKICMKLEDPMQRGNSSKDSRRSLCDACQWFPIRSARLMNNYLDNRGAQLEKRARIDLMDLKDQREGEATIFFKSNIIRANLFYANQNLFKAMRLNQFLKSMVR